MSDKELHSGAILAQIVDRTLKTKAAAIILKVTERTVRRKKAKMLKGGIAALAHGLRGKPSHNQLEKQERGQIEQLLREKYADFGPTFATEKLLEIHQISRDPKTIRGIMVSLGLWKPKKGRVAAKHRAWRQRRAQYGELIQYDGSYHNWLEGRDGTTEQCLLAAFDDATGDLVSAAFAPDEGTLATMGFWREYANIHGLPQAIYVDKFSTYKMNHETAKENPDTKTQFQRAMETLHVELIFANSPQAKGRVERGFRTLQDRLVKELRLQNITTTEEANSFLRKTFIADYSCRFREEAREKGDVHRKLTEREKNLAEVVLCKEETRMVLNDFTVPHGKIWYQILETSRVAIRPKDTVVIRTNPEGEVNLTIRGRVVNWKPIQKTRRPQVKHQHPNRFLTGKK